jgi:hypothetical protein
VKADTRAATCRDSLHIGETWRRDNWRLKKQLRLKQARLGDNEIAFAQEDWKALHCLLPGCTSRKTIELTLR